MPRTAVTNRRLVRDFSHSAQFTDSSTFGIISRTDALDAIGNAAQDYWVYTEFVCPRVSSLARMVEKYQSVGGYPFATRITSAGVFEVVKFQSPATIARTSTFRVDDGKWRSALACFAGSENTLRIYLNGVFNHSTTGAVAGLDLRNDDNIYIGRRGPNELPSFPGRIQTVAIGIGSISATDAANFHHTGQPPTSSSVLVYVKNGESSGSTGVDTSGNGNDIAYTSVTHSTNSYMKARQARA